MELLELMQKIQAIVVDWENILNCPVEFRLGYFGGTWWASIKYRRSPVAEWEYVEPADGGILEAIGSTGLVAIDNLVKVCEGRGDEADYSIRRER